MTAVFEYQADLVLQASGAGCVAQALGTLRKIVATLNAAASSSEVKTSEPFRGRRLRGEGTL